LSRDGRLGHDPGKTLMSTRIVVDLLE
jgi:hypothetical protein